jgi:hypothetical protein
MVGDRMRLVARDKEGGKMSVRSSDMSPGALPWR